MDLSTHLRAKPIAVQKLAILKNGYMFHRPLVEGLIDELTAIVAVLELAAIWPPVRFFRKLNADTKNHS